MGEVLGTRASEQKKKDFFCLFYLNCLLYYTFSPCFLRPCTFFTSFVFSYGKIAQFFRFPPSLLYLLLLRKSKRKNFVLVGKSFLCFFVRKNCAIFPYEKTKEARGLPLSFCLSKSFASLLPPFCLRKRKGLWP